MHKTRPDLRRGMTSLALAAAAARAQYTLVPIGHAEATSGAAEISAFDPAGSRLFTTAGTGLDVYRFDAGELTPDGRIELAGVVNRVRSVSSVAIDPAGRGFGIAVVVPEPNDTQPGKAVCFRTDDLTPLVTLTVGFNPDMVTFSPDGAHAFVADEGEPGQNADPPGTLSVLDLRSVHAAADLATPDAASVGTISFDPEHLAEGVTLDGVRISPRAPSPQADIEPEYIAPDNDGAWVSLQENNALARFDLDEHRWTAIRPLGGILQTVDASDVDGGVHIDDPAWGLPMPDSIATYSIGGHRFIVTVNEGDRRANDEVRFAEAEIDPEVRALLDAAYAPDAGSADALGRLILSAFDGDTDRDGDIDLPTMFGTRSFSIWNQAGGRLFDSGSAFEIVTAAMIPDRFNSDGHADSFDSRSDNSGPEPEGLTLIHADGRVLACVGLERVGGVMLYDITDPAAVRFIEYRPLGDDEHHAVAPEGLTHLEVAGEHYLIVSCEQSATIELLRLDRAP